MHVTDGIDMHHQRYECHDNHHHRRQRIDEETDLQRYPATDTPGIDAAVEGMPVDDNVAKHQQRKQE